MNEKEQEMIADLLTSKATVGLDPEEQKLLDQYLADSGEAEDHSYEIAAAAVGLVGLRTDEPLPEHLYASIMASADKYFAAATVPQSAVGSADPTAEPVEYQKTFSFEAPQKSSWSWLGWAVAGFAVIVLAVNVWFTRFSPVEVVKNPEPQATPQKLTPAEEYAKMAAEKTGIIKANWTPGKVKEITQVSGEVVWSDEKQVGYMHFKGLPANDKTKTAYQLWIFEENQGKETPIDGGVFDVDQNGEVVIPITAKLKAKNPSLFAITIEKPGGVVVSKKEKIAALATVGKTET